MAVGLLLSRLEVGRRLEIVDAHDGGGRLVMDHPGPVLLGADLGALPVYVVDRGAASDLQLAAGEVVVRNEKLKADLGDLPLRLVRVQGAVRADVRLQRLHRREPVTCVPFKRRSPTIMRETSVKILLRLPPPRATPTPTSHGFPVTRFREGGSGRGGWRGGRDRSAGDLIPIINSAS